MLKTRVIPCLLLRNLGLVKTVKFSDSKYVGDPMNTVKIFNDKEVDELLFLDISATNEERKPPFDLLSCIASEAFMPFGYGGGLNDLEDVEKILKIGIEKVIINTHAFKNPEFIKKLANKFGSQSIVVSIDVKKNIEGNYEVFINSGKVNTKKNPIYYAIEMEKMGAGEIFLTSIDRDGTGEGYDLDLIREVSNAVNIPVISYGGAGKLEDFSKAVNAGASAVAAGSLFVFLGPYRAVLFSYPTKNELKRVLE